MQKKFWKLLSVKTMKKCCRLISIIQQNITIYVYGIGICIHIFTQYSSFYVLYKFFAQVISSICIHTEMSTNLRGRSAKALKSLTNLQCKFQLQLIEFHVCIFPKLPRYRPLTEQQGARECGIVVGMGEARWHIVSKMCEMKFETVVACSPCRSLPISKLLHLNCFCPPWNTIQCHICVCFVNSQTHTRIGCTAVVSICADNFQHFCLQLSLLFAAFLFVVKHFWTIGGFHVLCALFKRLVDYWDY